MINLIITVILIVICIILANKKYPIQLVFRFMGLGLALVMTIVTGVSVAATSCGNIYLDIFEALKETFVSTFTSTGMSVIPIYAYATYMNHIKASEVLGGIISKPIAKAKNPYIVGTFMAIAICGIMRIAIVSAFAIMALFMTTLYPALTKAGMSRQSAMSAIFIGTCFDWGPADFVIAQMFGGVQGVTVPEYFLAASIRVVPFVLLIVAFVSGFVMQFIDKKSGYKLGDHKPTEEAVASGVNLPKFYAILPLLPLFFVLLFSPLFETGINLSVMGSVCISVIIVMAVEIIRRRNVLACFKDLMSWFSGMGKAFGDLITLIACIQFFSGMLGKLNGFTFLVNSALNAGLNGYLLLIAFGLLMFLTLLLNGGAVVAITLAPQAVNVAASLGISTYAALLPMQIAYGCRCINLGTSPHMQFVTKESQGTAMQILARCAIPCALMYILSFVFSLIIL